MAIFREEDRNRHPNNPEVTPSPSDPPQVGHEPSLHIEAPVRDQVFYRAEGTQLMIPVSGTWGDGWPASEGVVGDISVSIKNDKGVVTQQATKATGDGKRSGTWSAVLDVSGLDTSASDRVHLSAESSVDAGNTGYDISIRALIFEFIFPAPGTKVGIGKEDTTWAMNPIGSWQQEKIRVSLSDQRYAGEVEWELSGPSGSPAVGKASRDASNGKLWYVDKPSWVHSKAGQQHTLTIKAGGVQGSLSFETCLYDPPAPAADPNTQFTYTFENFFHPFVGELIQRINTSDTLSSVMDAVWQKGLEQQPKAFFDPLYGSPVDGSLVKIELSPKKIDLDSRGPYANYNWELFYHLPLTIAVHLSKAQRFAEAQRWFHYIFDPTSPDLQVDPSLRFWKFLAFSDPSERLTIDEILRRLSDPGEAQSVQNGYDAIRDKPFQPHAVARNRHLAYQYSVVMKYLDNLIAWGDALFQQDTVESINEATQRYVLVANILGPRPQRIPPSGSARPKSFKQLRETDLDRMGNALVELESQFPIKFDMPPARPANGDAAGSTPALFGIGRTLYFCIPRNDKLLGYWDTVADRLFKIRHCMNIAGLARPLALFDPPLDPGMLVKAAAAGINISSVVNGLNQPIGPLRSLPLIQKALELCGEVRGLGGALLAALEKGDAEHLSLVRQRHEIQIQELAQEVRFLQWKSAQEATKSLLTSRATALERLRYYQRLLGLPAEPNAPAALALAQAENPEDVPKLTEESFDETFSALVGQYDKPLALQAFPRLKLAGGASPAQQSGATGQGQLYLNVNEDAELNRHLPAARDSRVASVVADYLASVLVHIPDLKVDLSYWGLGTDVAVFGGSKLSEASRRAAEILRTEAGWEQDQAGMASRTAGHERRADEWLLQHNLAAHELMQIGRQILTSLIAEQLAQREYLNIKQQIENAQEVDRFLHEKFTNEDLYLWMQGEISRLYYEYYRFAFDTARKAERTMKQELMRPELDAQDFVKFNYWDGGRKGLLSGEALHLDVKRMEMAYHEHNKRELELTRHVSLRQLDPVALLTLKVTGRCQVTVPEWLFDMDCPGHYMRRIKSVALSIPSVVGPYTGVHCTLTLLKSSLRKSPILKDGEYRRQGAEDDRFMDTIGALQSIVTSTANNDSGMFETNLRDERFLPFEGAGAESTWQLELPDAYRGFDYDTIADVILHVRYTARQGIVVDKVTKALDEMFGMATQSNLALMFSLRHDFPTEWAAFVAGRDQNPIAVTIRKDYFPYFTQRQSIEIVGLELYDGQNATNHHELLIPATASEDLNEQSKQEQFSLSAGSDAAGPTQVLTSAAKDVFLVIRYSMLLPS